MSTSLDGCKKIPGWVKPFLQHIKNGFNDTNAANKAGVGSNVIRQRLANDPAFKNDYETAQKAKRPRFGHGAY